MIITKDKALRRKRRVRAEISGSGERPRIAIHRSNQYIYAQAIDDISRTTLAAATSAKLAKSKDKISKSEQAKEVGRMIGKALIEKKITAGVFDRSKFAYKGRVKLLAEGLREVGLKI